MDGDRMQDVQTVARALGLEKHVGLLEPEWGASRRTFPADGVPFLRPDFIRESAAYCGIADDAVTDMLAAARRFSARQELTALAWHGHRLLAAELPDKEFWSLPPKVLGHDYGLFNLLVLLSIVPEAKRFHEERGIPADVVADTMLDFMLCMRRYRELHGCWGVADLYARGWLKLHLQGRLYRLGRLQFAPGRSRYPFVAYRHRQTGDVVVLAGDQIEFRRDGHMNGAGGVTESEGVWTTSLREGETETVGQAVDPAEATASPETVRLPLDEWRKELGPDDPVLDMHIPAGAPLSPDACGKSIRRTQPFFARHFPEKPFRAICCSSWLFDPQLAEYLSPASNLVQFLRQFYLLPAKGNGLAAVRFVFMKMEGMFGGTALPPDAAPQDIDFSDYPRETTLQRVIIDHIEAGRCWRGAAALLLGDDAANYGSEPYRRQGRPCT